MINHKDQYYITIFFTLIRKRFFQVMKTSWFPRCKTPSRHLGGREIEGLWRQENVTLLLFNCYSLRRRPGDQKLFAGNIQKNRTILPNAVFQFVILNQWKVPWNWMTFYWHFLLCHLFDERRIWRPCKRDPFWNPIVSLKQKLKN